MLEVPSRVERWYQMKHVLLLCIVAMPAVGRPGMVLSSVF